MVVLVTGKKGEAPLKIKMPELPKYFSHYKPIVCFLNAQGQLTPQSEIESGLKVNSCEISWLSLLLLRMKYI